MIRARLPERLVDLVILAGVVVVLVAAVWTFLGVWAQLATGPAVTPQPSLATPAVSPVPTSASAPAGAALAPDAVATPSDCAMVEYIVNGDQRTVFVACPGWDLTLNQDGSLTATERQP